MTTALLAFLFLLFPFTTILNVAMASVRDTDGNWVKNGGNYYILPSFNNGGGVTVAGNGARNQLAVVQSASHNCLGLSISISSPHGAKIIPTDEIVNIKFTNVPDFNNSFTWILVMDESARVWYVGIGSAAEEYYPSNQIMKGNFQIKEYHLDYKLVFCSATNTSYCEDVGIYTDSRENNRLALNGAAFAVKFKNADEALAACE